MRPNTLYGDRIERLAVGHRIPYISRALRAPGRDVLVDCVAIERGEHTRDIREVAGRVTHAFFLYRRLREAIQRRANTEIRTVGVLYVPPGQNRPDLVDLRELYREQWAQQGADVIEGSRDEVVAPLKAHAEWAREGQNGR